MSGLQGAVLCGLHLLDPRILPFIAPDGFDTIIAAYQRARRKRHRIAGVFVPGSFWADIGTPGQYVQAHRDTARRLGANAVVEERRIVEITALHTPKTPRYAQPVPDAGTPGGSS